MNSIELIFSSLLASVKTAFAFVIIQLVRFSVSLNSLVLYTFSTFQDVGVSGLYYFASIIVYHLNDSKLLIYFDSSVYCGSYW
jgi:hypothetical protein